MNFLAHYIVAVRGLSPVYPLPFYVCGNALPDILPLVRPRHRLKEELLTLSPQTVESAALRSGVLIHFATDAAFHKTAAFAHVQKEVGFLLNGAGFSGIRIRNFFAAHVLTELALDAALLRREPTLADAFYGAQANVDISAVVAWAERMADSSLPALPAALSGFFAFPYLHSYRDDEGMAEGFNRLCKRAQQDTFEDENWQRLLLVVERAVGTIAGVADRLLTETGEALPVLQKM